MGKMVISCKEKFKVWVVRQEEERNTTECTKKVLNFCNFHFLTYHMLIFLQEKKKEKQHPQDLGARG